MEISDIISLNPLKLKLTFFLMACIRYIHFSKFSHLFDSLTQLLSFSALRYLYRLQGIFIFFVNRALQFSFLLEMLRC